MNLKQVAIGTQVRILSLQNQGSIRRRLLDLGMSEQTLIRPVLSSPSKHMRAYFIKGTTIALRDDESEQILVEERG